MPIKCLECQSDNAEGMNYCRQCGMPLPKYCPNCGSLLVQNDNFCGNCGHDLSTQEKVPPHLHPWAPELPSENRRTSLRPNEAEPKPATVVFSDLSGYTTLSEKLDPEEVKEIMNRIFAQVAEIVYRHEGFIEKYIGDAVVVSFGVSDLNEDHHVRALKAALEIHESIAIISKDYEQTINKRLLFHTGITTGLVGTLELTAGAVNLASRLCSIAKSGEILVSESTWLKSMNVFSFQKHKSLSVKGKTAPIVPYRLIAKKESPSPDITQPQSPYSSRGQMPTAAGAVEGERKHVTVLFSDLSGYTALSEKLDPEELKEIMSKIFGEISAIVAKYDGSIEKFIGDAIVAFFGVPKVYEDDHIRALRVACEIRETINTLSTEYEKKIGHRLAFHTAISTGLVVTGETRQDKGTLVGDTINLASRLCSIAKAGEILVSESTYLKSKGAFFFDRLDPVSVKGKAEQVIPYRLVGEEEKPSKGLATLGLTSPLVGRTAELAAINSSLTHLLGGQGGILSVIGEAGLGKSRLIAELRHSYDQENLLWIEGRTLSYGQKMSYWPFREMLWDFTGITEDDTDLEAWAKFERKIEEVLPTDSGEMLPYLASLIGLEVKGDIGKNLRHLSGESLGKQIYLSSRRFFERLAHTHPLVLVFEDLHWADESTVLLIEHLFPLTNRVPLLICGVSRPEIGAPAARLRDTALKDYEGRYTEIRLNPLLPTECTLLMNNLLNIENLSSRTRQLILHKADGNPFFLEEIMRTLLDRGVVRFENGRWRATSDIETITIPDTIQGVIMARIDRLDKELKQILRTASVIGRAFLYRLLKEVTEAVKQLDQHLDTLTASELIREKQKVPELEYIFKHALVQESTYESILLKKRHELHQGVAAAIETLFSERLDEFASVLAYHYAKAEHWEKAQEYLFKAGDQAGKIAADAEALTHYQQALEAYTKVFGDRWDPIERGILERKMGEAFYRRGDYAQAMEYLQRALVYFGRPRLPESPRSVRLGILKEIVVQLCHRMFSNWFGKKIGEPTDRTVEEAARTYEIVVSIEALTAPAAFLRTSLTCLNYYERKGYGPGIPLYYACLGFIGFLLSLSRIERFFLPRAVAVAEEIGLPAALIPPHADSAIADFHAGRLQSVIDHASRARDVSREAGYPNLLFWTAATCHAAVAHAFLGDYDTGLSLANELVRMGEDTNDPFIHVCGLWALDEKNDKNGRFQDCVAMHERAAQVNEKIGFHDGRVLAGYQISRSYLRLGEIEKSREALTQGDLYRIKHESKQFGHFISLGYFRLYLTAAERTDGKESEEWLQKAKQVRRKTLRWAKARPIILPEAARLQGVYDWLTGRQAAAQKHWQRSLAAASEMGMKYELAMGHLEMGRRLNDAKHLRQAESILIDIGAEWDLEQARRYLQSLAEREKA